MVGGYLAAATFLILLGGVRSASEESSLLNFKENILVDPFQTLVDWTLANPLGNWTGIICDKKNHVIHLNLENKLLRGSIAPDIANLKYLQYLNLQNNSFTGQIPSGIGNLSSLLELRLGLNPLSGSIPDDFWSMQAVSHINISGTNISGILSPTVQKLRNISYLYLHDNTLEGSIPSEVRTLKKLQILSINGNCFSGEFPAEIVGLPLISMLDISNNNFSGVVPAGRPGLNFRYSNNVHLSTCTNRRLLFGMPTPAPLASSKTETHSLHALAALIGVLVAVALLLLVGGVFYCCLTERRKQILNSAKLLEEHRQTHPWTVYTRRFRLDQLKKATKNFSPEYVIGSGGFGTVYKAEIDTCEVVAIKRSKRESHQQGSDEFHNEVELLSKIHHKNLVNLVGFCEQDGEQMLVYEYVPNGSLLEHIVGDIGMCLTWRQRVQIAIDSAKGIAYLHDGCTPAIIHRDIKPSNILLDYDLRAKVSDFGLSKTGPVGNASHVSTQVKGTPGYLDPHYYLSFHLSTFSDVYSFGVILLQLVTAKPAVDHSRKRSQYNIINWVRDSIDQGRLEDILDTRLLSQPYNREVLLEMSRLGLRCVNKDIKERPTMSMVGQELETTIRKTEMPMFLQLSMAPKLQARSDGLLSQKVLGDVRNMEKQDSNPSSGHNAIPWRSNFKQQDLVDTSMKHKSIERRITNYKGDQEENSTGKSVDRNSLETFHMEMESFSKVNVMCFDSIEWEDYHGGSFNNKRNF